MRPGVAFGGLGIATVAAFGLLLWAAAVEQKNWEKFAATHECKVTGKVAGYTTYGYYMGKYQTHYVPSRTTYHCNDGVDYTR